MVSGEKVAGSFSADSGGWPLTVPRLSMIKYRSSHTSVHRDLY